MSIKVKCPKCKHEFEAIEHPASVLKKPPVVKQVAVYAACLQSIGSTTPKPVYGIMKKGYNEIIETIDKKDGATWSEIKNNSSLSKATLAQRLKEARDTGLVEYGIRQGNGKRVYKLKKD